MGKFTQLREWTSRKLAILVAVGVASLAVVLWQALITREHAQIKLAVQQESKIPYNFTGSWRLPGEIIWNF